MSGEGEQVHTSFGAEIEATMSEFQQEIAADDAAAPEVTPEPEVEPEAEPVEETTVDEAEEADATPEVETTVSDTEGEPAQAETEDAGTEADPEPAVEAESPGNILTVTHMGEVHTFDEQKDADRITELLQMGLGSEPIAKKRDEYEQKARALEAFVETDPFGKVRPTERAIAWMQEFLPNGVATDPSQGQAPVAAAGPSQPSEQVSALKERAFKENTVEAWNEYQAAERVELRSQILNELRTEQQKQQQTLQHQGAIQQAQAGLAQAHNKLKTLFRNERGVVDEEVWTEALNGAPGQEGLRNYLARTGDYDGALKGLTSVAQRYQTRVRSRVQTTKKILKAKPSAKKATSRKTSRAPGGKPADNGFEIKGDEKDPFGDVTRELIQSGEMDRMFKG